MMSQSKGGVIGAVAAAVVAGIIILFIEYEVFVPAFSKETSPEEQTSITQEPFTAPEDGLSSNFSGRWAGEVLGDRRVYPMVVDIIDDGTTATATATYPDIPCAGTWTQQSRTVSTILFIEDMPDDVVCFDDVPVQLELQKNSILFTAQSGGYSLSAELK